MSRCGSCDLYNRTATILYPDGKGGEIKTSTSCEGDLDAIACADNLQAYVNRLKYAVAKTAPEIRVETRNGIDYISEVYFQKAEFERLTRLLDEIEDFDELRGTASGEQLLRDLRAKEDDEILVRFPFGKGLAMDFIICSGQHNYYTSAALYRNGRMLYDGWEAGHELPQEERFDYGDDTYICRFILI